MKMYQTKGYVILKYYFKSKCEKKKKLKYEKFYIFNT